MTFKYEIRRAWRSGRYYHEGTSLVVKMRKHSIDLCFRIQSVRGDIWHGRDDSSMHDPSCTLLEKEDCRQSPLDMFSLSIFPTEILECITGKVKTPEQVQLWQCGDRILNYKLKNGGLKRTSLCWSGSSWMPWPRWYFTTFDGIVDVEWGVDIFTPLCPTLELNLLPKTLKRLHLACDDLFLLLRKQNINMNDMLPMVHTLRLSGSRLREENLKNLPSNLIELQVNSRLTTLTSSTIFGDLPRTIQRLTFEVPIVDESEHENDLPSNLISLDIAKLVSEFNWFSKIPRTLKTLKIGVANFHPDWLTLPPQLERLEFACYISRVPKSILPQLPQSLKSLALLTPLRDLTGEDELIPLLPKNLTRLKLLNESFCHSGLEQLPMSLTDIDACIAATHPDILAIFRPETIKMRLGSGPFSKQLNILPFPINLQCLRIHYLNDDMCAMLPPRLQTLIFDEGTITTNGASKLPKSLTSLKTYFEVFNNNQAISHLGHISDLHLSIRNGTEHHNLNQDWLFSLSTSSTGQVGSGQDSSSQNIYPDGANHHLKSLKIQGYPGRNHGDSPYVQRPFFDALSKFKNLNKLEIVWLVGISNDWFALIPQTVTSLTILYLSAWPTANQLSSLPRGLTYLSLILDQKVLSSQCDLKDEDLQYLPRSLQHFITNYGSNGKFPRLTHRMHEYLPPNLQNTTLKYEISGSTEVGLFTSPLDRLYGKESSIN